MSGLPIEPVIPEILAALRDGNSLVLQAPPGAGKTTRVPLALLGQEWLGGSRIVMLEPRRLATRAAARRMASILGETVGGTVGYRMRLDTQVSKDTAIEVVTDGILIRLLQDNPSLDGIGAVIFDEYHERGLDADLGLALVLETQSYLRDDLRILVMSATLDGERVAELLGDAPIVTSAGRSFPVETRYIQPRRGERFEPAVANAVRQALAEEAGSALVFLPGVAEIRRVERLLAETGLEAGIKVMPLYGELPQGAQDAALQPAPIGQRKIVLATTIAETSLTIEGIRIVIDGGLMRVPRFDPRGGMTRLETIRVSQASADQRRGRAGRLEPGVCYRLWPEPEQRALARFNTPEILAADLAPLALELACWGNADPAQLRWLDPPPEAAYGHAKSLLRQLDALDSDGKPTKHGREMARFGLHPRLAHMVLAGTARGLACDIAAILSARDFLKTGGPASSRDADLRLRVEVMNGATDDLAGLSIDRGLLPQVRRQAGEWRRRIRVPAGIGSVSDTGIVLAEAYPDRIAQRRPAGNGQFLLSNGRGAILPPTDPLAAEDYLAVADLAGDKREARIFLAAPLTRAEIEETFADRLETRDLVTWDAREGAVLAVRQVRLGELVLRSERLADPPRVLVTEALLSGIRQAGLGILPWNREIETWRARVAFLRRVRKAEEGWPDLSDDVLLAELEDWLAPALDGITRATQLDRIDLVGALRARLDWEKQRALDALAPTHMVVPTGSRLAIDYSEAEPSLPVKLQEMFGAATTPAIADGAVKLRLQLLSPAGRPLQVTSDLAGFWATSYRAVRSEMRGRYPKHPWPEDPLAAEPTRRVKPRPA